MAIKIIMLVIFFGVMIGVGVYCRKHATDVNGFVLGGRNVGPWLTAFAYGTSYFSAVIFIGYAGQFGWKFGLASTWIGLGNAFIGSLLAWNVLGRRTRTMSQHLESKTMPEFFGVRFDSKMLKILASLIVFVFLIPYTASLYNGLSRLFGMAFHLDYTVCIVVMAVLTGIYVIAGGYMATAINDFIQGIIMLFGICAVIGAVLADKAPRLARWIPGFVIGWLRRTIHESEINYILEHYWNLPPQEFIRACFREWQVTYTVEGLEKLDPKGRYLFAANHPFGGMDGMMLADKLIDRFGDARVVVNDLLMHLEPLRPLWIPVNKHGSQNSAYARKFDEEFVGEVPILTFPAGLCSRCIGGEVTDLPWKTNFLKKAYASQREIVPVFVEGRLSNFFYRVARLRVMLGLKLNIEMLWLPDEMFSQKGRHFRIFVGDPIPVSELQRYGGLREQAEFVRKKAYFLENMLAPEPEKR